MNIEQEIKKRAKEIINSLTIRYDSQPPGLLKIFDTTLSIGLNIKFKT